MAKILIFFINIYQIFFSPDHSIWGRHRFPHGYCRFHPSCSEYLKQTLQKQNFFVAIGKGVWRVLRCNPYARGGYDPA